MPVNSQELHKDSVDRDPEEGEDQGAHEAAHILVIVRDLLVVLITEHGGRHYEDGDEDPAAEV